MTAPLHLSLHEARALVASRGVSGVPIPSPVRAYRLEEPLEWFSTGGSLLLGRRGDWAVEYRGEVWTLVPEVFAATYVQVDGDLYAKRAGVLLVEMDRDFVVDSLEGPSKGLVGDFLACGPLGDVWALPAARMRERYRLEF